MKLVGAVGVEHDPKPYKSREVMALPSPAKFQLLILLTGSQLGGQLLSRLPSARVLALGYSKASSKSAQCIGERSPSMTSPSNEIWSTYTST